MTPKTLQILCLCLILGIGQIIASHAEEEIINRAEPGDEDAFGHAVDVSGDTFITSHTSYEGNRGGIHIFKREKDEWESQAIIKSPDAAVRDWFGWAVAIDSDTAVVGAYEDGGKGKDQGGGITDGPGAVSIFVRTGKDWAEQAKLKAKDKELSDRFGYSVDIDGDTVIIGSPHDDDAGENSGSVYIFERAGDTWKETFKIVASDAAAGDKFGWNVGLERDIAVVGAYFDDDAGSKSGSAYIFVRNADGTWTEQAKLTADDAAKGDQFGVSVDISVVALNAYVIAGAHFKKGVGSRSGAAYVFVGSNGTWAQQAKLIPGDNQKGDQFGAAVAIDVNRVLVGAPKVDGKQIADSGAAYSFLRVGTDWIEQGRVEAKNVKADEVDALNIGDNFGNAVAISNRGELAIVGARWDNTEGGEDDGSVYVYDTKLGDLGIALAVEPSAALVTTTLGQIKRSALLQNFPNPFNPETWMPYVLAADAPVTVGIYDAQGHIVRQLNLGLQQAGSYLSQAKAAYWDGRDRLGEPVSSGIYFYTLRAGTFQATRRMVILK